jgi:hypothetical protein
MQDWLNDILANEWACMEVLRRARVQCDEPQLHDALECMLNACSENCIQLENIIRAGGGEPVNVPNQRFGLPRFDESLGDSLVLLETIQRQVMAEIDGGIDRSNVRRDRQRLEGIRAFHHAAISRLEELHGVGVC